MKKGKNYNRYGYAWNNPLKFIDISGEWLEISFGAAVAIGAAIGIATYTIVALTTWTQFTSLGLLKSAVTGAISGAVSFGVGELASTILPNLLNTTKLAIDMKLWIGETIAFHSMSAVMHAVSQGVIAGISGGKFLQGAASALISSAVAGAVQGAGNIAGLKDNGFRTILFGTVSGGITAELAGGNFWQGAAIGLTVSALNHLAHGNDGDSDPKRKLIRTTSSSLEGHDSSLSLRGVTKGFLDKFGKFYRSNVSAGLKVNSSLSVRAEIMTYIYSDNTADLYIHLSVNLSNYNSSNLFINYSIDGGYNKILYSGISKYKYGNSSTEQTISSPNYTPSYKGIVSHVLKNINLGSIVSIYSTVANDSFLGYIGKSQVIFDFKVK